MKIVIDTEKLQTTPYYAKNCVVTMEDIIKCGIPLQKGNWILQSNGKCKLCVPRFKCSNCDKISFEESNYCPRCGAKMDGEETESD